MFLALPILAKHSYNAVAARMASNPPPTINSSQGLLTAARKARLSIAIALWCLSRNQASLMTKDGRSHRYGNGTHPWLLHSMDSSVQNF